MSPPRSSIAYWKAATALAVAFSFALGPISAKSAHAFKLFGMKFFESDEEEAPVIDPVNYTLTFDAGTDDKELKEALENSSQLVQGQEKPVSGDVGLAIRARDDRDRLHAALYEKARYGGTIAIRVNGQDIDSLPPDPSFPDGKPIPVSVTVTPGPVFKVGSVRFVGDAAGFNPADYGLPADARADSTLIIKAGEKITLIGRQAKSGAPYMNLTERANIVLAASGKEIYRTPNFGEPPPPPGSGTSSINQ